MLRMSLFSYLGTRVRAPKLPAAFVIVGLAALLPHPACQRRAGPPDLPYAARIEADSRVLTGMEGERLPIRIELFNLGQEAWDSEASPPCHLSYHLRDRDRNMLRFDNRRFPLPRRIEPGGSVELEVLFRVPFQTGKHILEFDLVREGVAWFKEGGSATLEIPLEVKERRWSDSDRKFDLEADESTRFSSSVFLGCFLVGSSRVDLQACKLEYSIVSPK